MIQEIELIAMTYKGKFERYFCQVLTHRMDGSLEMISGEYSLSLEANDFG